MGAGGLPEGKVHLEGRDELTHPEDLFLNSWSSRTRHFSARPDHGQLHSSLLTPWHENEKRLEHPPPTHSAFGLAKAWSRLNPIRWRCINKDYHRALRPSDGLPRQCCQGRPGSSSSQLPSCVGAQGPLCSISRSVPASGIALFLCSLRGSTAPPPSFSMCPWALLKKGAVEGPCLGGDALRIIES